MWLQHSPWLDTTGLYSGDEQRRRLCLTEGTMERYAQEKATNPFTEKNSYYTTPLLEAIRCEPELTSGVRY
jgi:hypothetical protein